MEGSVRPELKMTAAAFAAAFPETGPRLAWFFGAGTSASAGIPTGYDMILDFKTRLFCAATGLPRREIDPSDPLWRERIESYFDGANGLPPLGSPDEYAAAFEAVHPTEDARRAYIEDAVRLGSPSFGHRVFAALICQRLVPCLFTTNFDPLVEHSVIAADDQLPSADRVHPTVAALDSVERAARCLRDGSWPLVAKLHGDYKSDRLMNTPSELAQDTQLRQVLMGAGSRFGLAVAGYSGRDQSVMEALRTIAAQPGGFPAGLYWFTRPRTPLLPAVQQLLEAATATTTARMIEVENFDELAGELDRHVVHSPALERIVRGVRVEPRLRPVVVPSHAAADFPILRCSAIPLLAMPTEARRIELETKATTPEVRDLLREHDARATASCQGTTVAVFGRDEVVLAALSSLGPRLAGTVALDPTADSWALGLLYDGLVRALAQRRPLRPVLRRSGHALLIAPPNSDRKDAAAASDRSLLRPVQAAYSEAITGSLKDGSTFAEAVHVRLEHWLGRWWAVFDPFTWVDLPDDAEPVGQVTAVADWRRERWALRYNRKWAGIIDAWAHLLAPERETTAQASLVGDADGVPGDFTLSQVTAWSRPGQQYVASEVQGGRR